MVPPNFGCGWECLRARFHRLSSPFSSGRAWQCARAARAARDMLGASLGRYRGVNESHPAPRTGTGALPMVLTSRSQRGREPDCGLARLVRKSYRWRLRPSAARYDHEPCTLEPRSASTPPSSRVARFGHVEQQKARDKSRAPYFPRIGSICILLQDGLAPWDRIGSNIRPVK